MEVSANHMQISVTLERTSSSEKKSLNMNAPRGLTTTLEENKVLYLYEDGTDGVKGQHDKEDDD